MHEAVFFHRARGGDQRLADHLPAEHPLPADLRAFPAKQTGFQPLDIEEGRGELAGVYVVQDGRLLLRQLRLGARSGDTVEVIAGLKAGEVVASDPVAATQAIAAQRKAAEANRD